MAANLKRLCRERAVVEFKESFLGLQYANLRL